MQEEKEKEETNATKEEEEVQFVREDEEGAKTKPDFSLKQLQPPPEEQEGTKQGSWFFRLRDWCYTRSLPRFDLRSFYLSLCTYSIFLLVMLVFQDAWGKNSNVDNWLTSPDTVVVYASNEE